MRITLYTDDKEEVRTPPKRVYDFYRNGRLVRRKRCTRELMTTEFSLMNCLTSQRFTFVTEAPTKEKGTKGDYAVDVETREVIPLNVIADTKPLI